MGLDCGGRDDTLHEFAQAGLVGQDAAVGKPAGRLVYHALGGLDLIRQQLLVHATGALAQEGVDFGDVDVREVVGKANDIELGLLLRQVRSRQQRMDTGCK